MGDDHFLVREDHILLGTETAEKRGTGHAGGVGQLIDAGGVKSLVDQQFEGGNGHGGRSDHDC
nr:hypothetical protein [Glutamicibacter creatinolyticus]